MDNLEADNKERKREKEAAKVHKKINRKTLKCETPQKF